MKKNYGRILTGIFLAAAIGCMIYGAVSGEAGIVLQKAIRVCMECVGIG